MPKNYFQGSPVTGRSTAGNASRFLALFGLPPDFSRDELVSSYRTLAKLNHPDVTGDPESEMRMVIINEAYRYLSEEYSGSESLFVSRGVIDPPYDGYRRAFSIMSKAFVDYYGEGDKRLESDIETLRMRLIDAKNEFAALIEAYPSSHWTPDAIDRVFSINKWL